MRFSFLAAAAILASSFSAHADTIFSNVTESSASDLGDAVGGVRLAAAFSPSESAILTGATALLFQGNAYHFNYLDVVDFSIYSGSGSVPVSVLEDLGTVSVAPDANHLFTASVPGSLTVLAGQRYWLVLSDSGNVTYDTVWAGSGSTAQPFAFTDLSGAFTSYINPLTVQFSISGTPLTPVAATPEPSSIALLGTGMIGMAGVLRKRLV